MIVARILVVDDEEADRAHGRAVLESAGHEVLFAPSGEAALRIYAKQAVDLVITDLAMPNLNGLRLIEQIRERDGRALIIAVSGVSPEQFDRAQALGAVATMAKPFSPEELLRVVSDALATTYSPPPDDLWR